jgi:hypothetical protein
MKMKKSLLSLALALGAFLVVSCSDSSQNQLEVPNNTLGLETENPQSIHGNYSSDAGKISYSSSTNSKNTSVYNVSVGLGENQVQASIRYDMESFELNGNATVLSSTQKEAFLALANELYNHIEQKGGENVSLLEFSLVRMLEYWGNAPTGYAHGLRTFNIESMDNEAQRLGNEGVTCIKKNTNVRAEYDDSRGTHNESVRVGSKARSGYGCMGRCGADCGRWWLPSAWTKDCMDHDQCSAVNNSSGGSSDSNCGDEFDEAADDWIFGVVRGCRG